MTVAQKLIGLSRGFSPLSITGLVGHYDFSDATTLFTDTARTTPVASDADAIAGVTDKSGFGAHLSQGTAIAKPAYKVNIIGGKSIARFDGNDLLYSAAYGAALSQPGTVFVVSIHSDNNADSWMFASSSAALGWIMFRNNGATDHWASYAGAQITGALTADASAHIFAGIFNGGSSKLYIDGGTADASGNAGANTHTLTGVGAASNGGAASSAMLGDVAEVLVYNALLTTTQLDLVGNYLKAKYTLTWSAAA